MYIYIIVVNTPWRVPTVINRWLLPYYFSLPLNRFIYSMTIKNPT